MDWNDLQRLTTDSLRIYEALRRAERLSEEGERLLREAEDLLRRAALAYLLEPLPLEYLPTPEALPAEAMAGAWVWIEQAWADLKDALYRLAKSYVEEKWDTARPILSALLEIEPGYRDCGALLTDTYLREARARFSQGRWEEGRILLTEAMTVSHVDKKQCRLAFLLSFLNEAHEDYSWNWNNPSFQPYFEWLATHEPRVRGSSTFNRAAHTYFRWFNAKRKSLFGSDYDERRRAKDEADSVEIAWLNAKWDLESVLSALVLGEESH